MLSEENAEQTVILANLKNNLIVVVVINKMAGFFGGDWDIQMRFR